MKSQIKQLVEASIKVKTELLQSETIIEQVDTCVAWIAEAFRADRKVLFCGNGGSAADAQHLSAEFSGRFYKNRKPLASEALHCNTSYLTAVGNDFGFDHVYSRMVEAIGRAGDILIALSTSGNSKNIIEALKAAKQQGMKTIALGGKTGGTMKEFADLTLCVPSTDTPRIQECHILLGHIICQLVEEQLFAQN